MLPSFCFQVAKNLMVFWLLCKILKQYLYIYIYIYIGREVDNKLFVNNLIQYKAYLMHSGYDDEAIDTQFIKVAKMKRKETLESKPSKNRVRPKQRKYNFVTTWDPMFPDIGRAIREFVPLLAEDEECNKLSPKGSFRMAYKPGHKNLKEILAPSMISTLEGELGRNSKSG